MTKILTLISLFLLFSCTKKNNEKSGNEYLIQAKINGFRDSTKVVLFSVDRFELIDSTYIMNNHFSLNGFLNEPENVILYFKEDLVFLKEKIGLWLDFSEIHMDVNNIKNTDIDMYYLAKEQIKGSELNHLFIDYHNKIKDVYKKLGKKAYYKEISEFVFSQPNNYLSVSIAYDQRNSVFKTSLKDYYDLLDKKYKNSVNGKAIKNFIEAKRIDKGSLMPPLAAKNLKGKVIDISEIKDTVILLNFWSSTCAPCRFHIRNEFPLLITKYKNKKFKIVNFSLDTNYKMWKKASEDDKIRGVNISDLKGTKSKITINYNINLIPQYYIIDKNGIVRGLNIGFRDGSIEDLLDELLDQK